MTMFYAHKIKDYVRFAFATIMSLIMCFALSACDGQVPKAAEGHSTKELPNVTSIREKDIRLRVLRSLERANEEKNSSNLDGYMSGPAMLVRTSELAIAAKTGKLDPKTTIPREVAQTIVPTNANWPRDLMTITTTTKDQQSKRLLVIRQDRARSNYKLWAVARLFPGVRLPKFPVSSIGASMGKANDSGLVMTPHAAAAAYADVLQQGESSKFAKSFASDYLRAKLAELSKTVQAGMERNKGSQEQVFASVPNQISVMRASDGSDLVVARIDSVWTRRAGEGRESRPASDEEKALFGNAKATSTMRVTYVNVVAMVIPPAGSNAQIVPVGAERQPIKVEAL
ncbi:hypothetical protein [Gardnerella vaginalis]|uniref:hypothetical protein n=1 Tax=Gardnerella vaginalis TaxID=2702 RepID=UPI0002E8044D|nr:hypothetical protein [Gardnerella vaginalis]